MSLQQVKSYVAVRYAEHITRFKGVSNEQIVKSYSFNYELVKAANRLIERIANAKGVTAIVGKRGAGKTHMLSLVRSLANQPNLIATISDSEARNALQKHALLKIPDSGVASLTLGFDLERGLDFIKVFPMGSIQTTSLRGWISPEQVLALIVKGVEKFGSYVLFIDGLSPALKHPEKNQYAYHFIKNLADLANQGDFGLVITLDEDIAASDSEWSDLCQIEKIDIKNLAIVIEQKLFRKTPEQRLALEQLYKDICKHMPHFSSELEEFINLYPTHPAILQVAPAMHRYVKTFSLLSFLTEHSNTALIRRDTSLINLDDLFENLEDELRKHPYLKEIFGIYDNLLYWAAVHLDSQKALYAKLLLRSLLILSLIGHGATLEEMANGVMLNDERGSSNFLKQLQVIMNSLIEVDPRIGIIDFGTPRYIFRDLFEMEPLNTEQLNPTKLNTEQMALIKASLEEPDVITTSKKISFLDAIHKEAEKIADDDERLQQLLISTGRRFFKDWPFVIDNTGNFKQRAELNIRWCGSLRRGIFKLGGEVEIIPTKSDQENSIINEYDWQINLVLPNQKNIPSLINAPKTLLYWQPTEISKEDWLALKYLIVAHTDLAKNFEPEEVNNYITAFETNLVDLFGLAYLEGGKIFNLYQESWPLNYHSSNFINIILSRLLDKPLSLRYPMHPRFEDLLDPDYLDEIASWMFSSDKTPTPDQQVYLEQFARPLDLLKLDGGKYILDIDDKKFAPTSPVGNFLQLLDQAGERPLTKNQAYRTLRVEPFGLQRPALMVILAALAAAKKIQLIDDENKAIHNEGGLKPDLDITDFSTIYNITKPKAKVSFWENPTKTTSPATTGAVFSNQTIMLVEDEPDILTCIEIAVEPLGCKVKTAINGLEALKQLLLDSKVDLVISDLMMPGMDGVQLFHEMQTNPELRDIPFIVLSSIDSEEDIAKALESGVTDYWTKPFSIIELTARIKKFLRRRLAAPDAYSITAWPNEKSPESAFFAPSEFRSGEMKALPIPNTNPAVEEKPDIINVTFFEIGTDFDSQKLYDQYADIYLRNGNMSEIPEYEDFEAQLLVKLNKLKKQFRCNNFSLYVEVKDDKSQVFCQLRRSTEYLAKEPKFLLM